MYQNILKSVLAEIQGWDADDEDAALADETGKLLEQSIYKLGKLCVVRCAGPRPPMGICWTDFRADVVPRAICDDQRSRKKKILAIGPTGRVREQPGAHASHGACSAIFSSTGTLSRARSTSSRSSRRPCARSLARWRRRVTPPPPTPCSRCNCAGRLRGSGPGPRGVTCPLACAGKDRQDRARDCRVRRAAPPRIARRAAVCVPAFLSCCRAVQYCRRGRAKRRPALAHICFALVLNWLPRVLSFVEKVPGDEANAALIKL